MKKALKKDLYTLRSRDVAHILDMCPDDVIMLARKDVLWGKKVGRLWKFRLSDVMKYKKKTAAREGESSGRVLGRT